MRRIACSVALVMAAVGCEKNEAPAASAGTAPAPAVPTHPAPAPAVPAPAPAVRPLPAPAALPAPTAAPVPTVAPARPAAGSAGTEIPHIDGLVADLPPGAIPNEVGDGAGFHADDGSVDLNLMVTPAEDAAKTMLVVKDELDKRGPKNWMKEATTADGFQLAWDDHNFRVENREPWEGDTVYVYEVRRKIGDVLYTCYGTLHAKDRIEPHLAACASIRPK